MGIYSSYVTKRIILTGRALNWQQDSRELLYFGSLLDNLGYNAENDKECNFSREDAEPYIQPISITNVMALQGRWRKNNDKIGRVWYTPVFDSWGQTEPL